MASPVWAYGITTVPSRRETFLPRTLASLKTAGFDTPRLFVDGGDSKVLEWYENTFQLPTTVRGPEPLKTFGNWILALAELYIRQPNADRFAIFQDDVIFSKNLRSYLNHCPYPEKGYWNLYTTPQNQALAPKECNGWYLSNQMGRGALALVFNRSTASLLFTQRHMVERPLDVQKGKRNVDGGVITALQKEGYKEYVHTPSLVQHIGQKSSSMGNEEAPIAISFRGEAYNLLDLLKCTSVAAVSVGDIGSC